MAFFNTKDGAGRDRDPPADDGVINGSIMDAWQAALEDVGPAGVDKGAGGKYLILPPGYSGSGRTAISRFRRATIRATRCCARS